MPFGIIPADIIYLSWVFPELPHRENLAFSAASAGILVPKRVQSNQIKCLSGYLVPTSAQNSFAGAANGAVGKRHSISIPSRHRFPPTHLPNSMRPDVTEDDLLAFITTSIGSIWALELLLLFRRDPSRGWDAAAAVRELRSSPIVIEEAVARLRTAGLIVQDSAGLCRYHAASPRIDRLASELATAYAAKPIMVINAIAAARSD
jgi:hypothetical protein